MADTTIRVDTQVRDRLAELAHERGTTIGRLVATLAETAPTRAETTVRHTSAKAYVLENFGVDVEDGGGFGGAATFWDDLVAGNPPSSL
jgi:hypothetical protein